MRIIVTTLVFWSLVTCSSQSVKNSEDPQLIYETSLKETKDENYLEANDLLNELKRRFPQSKYSVLADLTMADIQYQQDSYLEAAALYKNFVNLYPQHEKAAYAQHRLVISFLKNAPENIARDQNSAERAAISATHLKNNYPNSPESKEADELYFKARLRLAEKELYVARFYNHREAWEAALKRIEGIDRDFTDLSRYAGAKTLLADVTKLRAKLQGHLSKK